MILIDTNSFLTNGNCYTITRSATNSEQLGASRAFPPPAFDLCLQRIECLCCVKAVSSLSSCNLHAHLLLSSPGVGGGVTSLQEANGDVPQDGVAFSRLVYYHEVGGILNRVIRMGSHIF